LILESKGILGVLHLFVYLWIQCKILHFMGSDSICALDSSMEEALLTNEHMHSSHFGKMSTKLGKSFTLIPSRVVNLTSFNSWSNSSSSCLRWHGPNMYFSPLERLISTVASFETFWAAATGRIKCNWTVRYIKIG